GEDGVSRVESDGSVVPGKRLLEPSQIPEHGSQVVGGYCMVRIDLNSLPVRLERFPIRSLSQVSETQSLVTFGEPRIQRDCLAAHLEAGCQRGFRIPEAHEPLGIN